MVPIPGSRRIERLEENAAAADITLTENDLHRLELIAPVGRRQESATRSR